MDQEHKQKLTRREYIEMSAKEMKKFKHINPISQEEIDEIDWEEVTPEMITN